MTENKVEIIRESYKKIIEAIGEDSSREGLLRTPLRAANGFMELCQGYNMSIENVINEAVFSENYHGIVTIKDIDFFSLCEHHLVPFYGHITIGYIPNGKILGLSKFARVVEIFSRRLQVQERLTNEILESIQTILNPRGIGIIIEGTHLCMAMRGIKKPDTSTVTTAVRGEMKSPEVWQLFMKTINKS